MIVSPRGSGGRDDALVPVPVVPKHMKATEILNGWIAAHRCDAVDSGATLLLHPGTPFRVEKIIPYPSAAVCARPHAEIVVQGIRYCVILSELRAASTLRMELLPGHDGRGYPRCCASRRIRLNFPQSARAPDPSS